MISDPKSASDGRAKAWAAEQLGVPSESPPEVCTAAFLRRLADEDFVPPPRLREAWELAARGSSDDGPAMRWLDTTAEAELSGRVEEFAAQFFNLPPEQRSAHWERLYADARRRHRLETRLRRLKPGLAIEFKPERALSLREAKLVQWIRELFPLPPEQRAVRRRQMLRDDGGRDIRPWQKAAQRVGRRQRAVAALAPDLLLPLATWSRGVKAATRNRQRRKVAGVKWWRPIFRAGPNLFKSTPWIPVAIVVVSWLVGALLVEPHEHRHYDPPIYSPPIQRQEWYGYTEDKRLHDAYEILKKQGQFPSRAPSDQSPPITPQISDGPRSPPGTTLNDKLREVLAPQDIPQPEPTPEAPAGPAR
jgi:hypothetical protein